MTPRFARQYVLLDPTDCVPPHGLDLSPGSRDEMKVKYLESAFRVFGFDPEEPALIGYPLNGHIQLLSGTHRHEAARRAGILLPVSLRLRSDIEAVWGTDGWLDFFKDVPVKDLEQAEVPATRNVPGLDERVDLTRDVEADRIVQDVLAEQQVNDEAEIRVDGAVVGEYWQPAATGYTKPMDNERARQAVLGHRMLARIVHLHETYGCVEGQFLQEGLEEPCPTCVIIRELRTPPVDTNE